VARDKLHSWIGSHGNVAQQRSDADMTVEPGEHAIEVQAADDEPIRPISSD
jgi:hypothetical protein